VSDDPHGRIVAIVESAPAADDIDLPQAEPADREAAPKNRTRGNVVRPDKPVAAPSPSGSGGGDEAGSLGDVLDEFNREFSFVMMGSKAVIMRETPWAPIEDRTRIWSLEAFKAYFQNRTVRHETTTTDPETGQAKTKVVWKPIAPLWLTSKKRRTYDGIEFYPDPQDAPNTKGYFNLWRGFDVDPAFHLTAHERRCACATFYDHLLTNICRGDETLATWIFAWFAHMVQKPRERIGTAIVLRGREGTGKTVLGQIVGSLFPSHYFLVDDPRYLVGQFNAHMASCLLLQVDEGFWAGDKAAEGRLKGLITADRQMIEAKGIDPIRLDNYVRLMFSSNEDWVVPVGLEGRRYVVLHVGDAQRTNAEYFSEMAREMREGGREALLADLLDFDLRSVNLREVPKTEALFEQKMRSLDSVTSWWYERLCDGNVTRRRGGWAGPKGSGGFLAVDLLFEDYVHVAEKVGVRRKSEKTAFGMKMRRLLEFDGICLLRTIKRTTEVELADGSTSLRRVPCYEMPALADCRAAFEQACGQSITWIAEEDEAA